MKFLLVLLLAGFALAAAVPVPSQEDALDEALELDEFLSELALENEGDDVKGDLEKQIRERFEKLLEDLKDKITKGKEIKETLIEKLKELREKMKEKKIDFTKKAKEIFEKLKDTARDYFKKIFDTFTKDERAAADDDNVRDDMVKSLREALDKILDKIKEAVGQGKGLKEDYTQKIKEIREKLKEMKEDIGAKAKELLKKIKEKAKNYWKQILEDLGLKKGSADFHAEQMFEANDNENPKTELGKKLRGHLDKFLEIVKDAIDHGKTVKESTIEKIKELRERLKELKEDIGQHARELLQHIKEKAKDYFKNFWEKLGFSKKDAELQAELFAEELEAEEGGGRFLQRLKERFNKLVEEIKGAMGNGKSFDRPLEKLKELRERLKNISIGGKGKEFLEKLKEKIEDFFRTFKDKIGASSVAEADFNILDMFRKLKQLIKDKVDPEELKAKVEKIFGRGSELAEQFINALKKEGEKGKNKILEILNRILGDKESKRSVKDVYEKVKNYFKDLNIELKENFSRFGEWVRDKYGKVLEKGKDRVETVKKIAREFLEDTRLISKDIAREARDFLKEYKDDLGLVYDDIREKVREILNRKD